MAESASLPLSAHQTVKLAQLVDRDEMWRGLPRTHTVLARLLKSAVMRRRAPHRCYRHMTPRRLLGDVMFYYLRIGWGGSSRGHVHTPSATEGNSAVFGLS